MLRPTGLLTPLWGRDSLKTQKESRYSHKIDPTLVERARRADPMLDLQYD